MQQKEDVVLKSEVNVSPMTLTDALTGQMEKIPAVKAIIDSHQNALCALADDPETAKVIHAVAGTNKNGVVTIVEVQSRLKA